MNVLDLNRRMYLIMQNHNLIVKESIQHLKGTKIGVSDEYLFKYVIENGLVFTEVVATLKNFKQMVGDLIIVFSGCMKQQRNSEVKKQQRQLTPLHAITEACSQADIEWVLAPSSSMAQLRHLFQNDFIQAIACLPSMLQYCAGFKDLQNIILNISNDHFLWVDIKSLALKSQLSIDSLSELYTLYDFAEGYQDIFRDEEVQSVMSNKNFDSAADAQFTLAYTMFQGKNTQLEYRLQKAPLQPQVAAQILNYNATFKLTPVVTNTLQYLHPLASPSDMLHMDTVHFIKSQYHFIIILIPNKRIQNTCNLGPQLPQEIWFLRQSAIGEFFNSSMINSIHDLLATEYDQLKIYDMLVLAQSVALSILPKSYKIYQKKTDNDSSKLISWKKFIEFQTKDMKLSEALELLKSKVEQNEGISPSSINDSSVQMNLNIRFVQLLNFPDTMLTRLGTIKEEYIQPALIICHLLNLDQVSLLTSKLAGTIPDTINQQTQYVHTKEKKSVIMISRIITLLSYLADKMPNQNIIWFDIELIQFSNLMNQLSTAMVYLQESVLIHMMLMVNDRSVSNHFLKCSLWHRRPMNPILGVSMIALLEGKATLTQIQNFIPNILKLIVQCSELIDVALTLSDYINKGKPNSFSKTLKEAYKLINNKQFNQ